MKYFRMRALLAAGIAAGVVALSVPATAAMMAPPSVSVVSPAPGSAITGKSIRVSLSVQNFNVECANAGKTAAPMGEGHVHAMIDGMNMAHLAGMECSKDFALSTQGLAPGKHMLTIVLANDAHVMNSMPVMVPFNYEPSRSNPLPAAMTAGRPSVLIVSPRNGASIGKKFNLVLAVDNFDLSCNLEGKNNIAGWGHVHVFVQQNGETNASAATPMVAMMQTPQGMKMGSMLMQRTGMSMDALRSMMTMAQPGLIGMPCTKTIPVNLSAWRSGHAKIIVQLANNDHMPAMGTIPAIIDVNLK